MSRICRGLNEFRSGVMLLILLSLMCVACRQASAQTQDRLSPESQPVLKTYPIVKAQAADAERVLREVFAQRKIFVSHNSAQNAVMVWATDAEHPQIEHFLKQQQVLGTQLPPSETAVKLVTLVQRRRDAQQPTLHQMRFANTQAFDAGHSVPAVWENQQPHNQLQGHVQQVAARLQTQEPPSIGIATLSSNQTTRPVALQKLSASQFEAKMLNALQSRSVQPVRSDSGNQVIYTVPLANNQQISVTIDRSGNVVSISGPTPQVEAFVQVVRLLEAEASDSVTSVVPITPGNESSMRDLARLVNQPGANQFNSTQNLTSGQTANGNGIRLGDSGQTQGNGQTRLPIPPDASGLVGPLDITILDGGMVVINARTPGDLELARKIIEYIEAASREFDPVIVEVPMVHADCMRVAYVTQQLYAQWYDNQRGAISITPLVRPNSILLIGYPGSIEAARELIAKLDAPIDAEAQFQVFHLRHAASDTLKTTLDSFFSARTNPPAGGAGTVTMPTGTGLASAVNVVSDQRTNSLIVQAAPRDLLEIATLVLKLDKAGNEVNMVVEIFPLRNTLATNLQTILTQALTGQGTTGLGGVGGSQQLVAPQAGISFTTIDAQRGERVISAGIFSGVSVAADSNGNNLVVKAPKECMDVVRAVIKNLDSPPLAVAQMKIFTIINSDASTLLTMLQTIFQTTTTGGGAAGSVVPNYQLGDSNENSAMVQVRFAAEARTNSIVAVGTADTLAMVEAILLSLDEPEMHNRRMMVYRLLNTPASTIATTLQTFLQNERQLRQQAQALVGDVDIFNSEIIITAETETNSLLVSTTPRHFEQLRKMIQVLDERPAMVKIQVLIGEIDLSNTNEVGFELGIQDSLLFDRSVNGVPGFDFNGNPLGNNTTATNPKNVGSQGVSNFALGRQNSELGYGGLVLSASSESVSVLVRALEERNKLTVLNRPMLNVLHNQTASIMVGETVPMIAGTTVTDTGGQSNSVDYQDVGIRLEVTPRISLDDTVAMQITATKSSMGAESEGIPIFVQGGQTIRSPKIKNMTIGTTILAKSGQVALLGGLISTEDQSLRRGVPVVSDIPLVGQLFQYNYKQCSRKEVIFIFEPQVVRSEEEANALKQLELRRIHWCSTQVAGLLDNSGVKTRMDDFTSSETVIERGNAIRIDGNETISDERMIERSTNEDRMIPQQPTRAPGFPTPGML